MHAHEPFSQLEASRSSTGIFTEASTAAAVRRAAAAVRVLDSCVGSVHNACMQCMQLRDKGECVDAFDARVACIAAGVRALPAALGWQTQHAAMCARPSPPKAGSNLMTFCRRIAILSVHFTPEMQESFN